MHPMNKPRLYLAFWSDVPGHPYHVGLLLTPANPEPSIKDSTVFHVKNLIGSKDGQGPVLLTWTYMTSNVHPRTRHLVAVVLLGKLQNVTVDDIHNALQSVEIPPPVPAERVFSEEEGGGGGEGEGGETRRSNWNCAKWASDAMDASSSDCLYNDPESDLFLQILAGKKIIEIPCPGSDVYAVGLKFASSEPAPQKGRMPTCNMDGTAVEGEIIDLVVAPK